MTKTNKYLKWKKRKINKSIKMIGGNKSKEDILNEVKLENNSSSVLGSSGLTDSVVFNKVSDLAEGVAVNAVEKIGKVVGLDLTNKEETEKKLERIKNTISNPNNVKKIGEIVRNISEVGNIVLESAEPFIDPLIENVIEKGTSAAEKVGQSAVKIGLNTAEEIPGIGILIGTVRSLSNAGEAALAVSNATNELTKDFANTTNAVTKNFKELIKEKGDILKRTRRSIEDFTNQTMTNVSNMSSNVSNMSNINDIKNMGKDKINTMLKENMNKNMNKLTNVKPIVNTRSILKMKGGKKYKTKKRVKFML